jgi:hypothetical protein
VVYRKLVQGRVSSVKEAAESQNSMQVFVVVKRVVGT